jgi:hypothetical protein
MTYFVMAPTFDYFLSAVEERLAGQVKTFSYSSREVICENGDRYCYPSSLKRMRGVHPCRVLSWGWPFQFEIDLAEIRELERE